MFQRRLLGVDNHFLNTHSDSMARSRGGGGAAQWRKRGRETGMEGGEGNETREREVKDRDGKRATGKRGRERGRKEGGREGGRNLGH